MLYVPNTGADPEQRGLSVASRVGRILWTLRRDAGADTSTSRLLDVVLLDTIGGAYPEGTEPERLTALGVEILDVALVTPANAPHLDPEALSEVLVSLVWVRGALGEIHQLFRIESRNLCKPSLPFHARSRVE